MARKLTCYMPGIAAVTPTPDWCEFITMEYRCESSSRREVIYGSACGRWCFPQQTKHAMIDMWSAGGNGGGACCCQSGGASQGGYYGRACASAGSNQKLSGGGMCYVIAHGGCCKPMWGEDACFSMVSLFGFQNSANSCWCICGGLHERPSCYRTYCCYQCMVAPDDHDKNRNYDTNNVGTKPRTVFTQMCHSGHQSYNYSGGRGGNNAQAEWHHGRAPWIPAQGPEEKGNHKKSDGWSGNKKNNVFIGTNKGRYGPYCDDEKNLTYRPTFSQRCDQQVGEYCAHASKYMARAASASGHGEQSMNAYIPWTSDECYNSCNDWQCGQKVWTTSSNGVRATTRFINLTNMNGARACGGWNWSQWHLCHNGSNNNNCYQNIRTVGYGGKTATVCGGPCCCGGYGGNGAIVVKYKGGIKDDHGDKGRWG